MNIRGNSLTTVKVLVGLFGLFAMAALAAPAIKNANSSTLTKTFSWTPAANTALGKHTVTIVATDDKGGTVEKDITIEVLPALTGDEPTITGLSIIPSATSARILWQTNKVASAHVDLGFNQQHYKRVHNEPDSRAGKDHDVTVNQLLPCTTYVYNVRAKELSQKKEGRGTPGIFTTKGCPGEAAIAGQSLFDVAVTSGGAASLSEGDTTLTVSAPPNFAEADANLQIHQLEATAALAALPTTAGLKTFNQHIYDIKALTDIDLAVSALNKPVTLTFHYPANLTSTENNLKIYHWQGTSWQALPDCQVQAATHTITCSTNSLSPFALFESLSATPLPTPTAVAQHNGSSDSSASLPSEARLERAKLGIIAFNVASGHKITGPYSGLFTEGKRKIATLAAGSSRLAKKITVARGNYWLEIHAKHDKPGPVRVGVEVNGRLWKIITLAKNDNLYRTTRVGLLRNLTSATIRFRLLNDTYDRRHPTNADTDRNLHIEWWRLVGQGAPSQVAGTRDNE